MLKVIDISNHNGDIDFAKVKADGIDAVIIRIGLTGYGLAKSKKADKQFETNYAKAKAAGLPVGGYYYSCAYTEAEAKEEAAVTLKLIKNKTFELPIFYDVEDCHSTSLTGVAKTNQLMLGGKALTDIAEAYCTELSAAGKVVGVYTFSNWWANYLDKTRLAPYEKWIAHWTTDKDYSDEFDIWQYTDSGKIAGIKSNCDLNVCYKDYTAKAQEPTARDWEADYKVLEKENKTLHDKFQSVKDTIKNLADYINTF